MTDFIEWDGTEECLYNLLLWWGTREPFVHSPGCKQEPNVMHCCEGVPWSRHYAIQASTSGPDTGKPPLIDIEFVTPEDTLVPDTAAGTPVEIGDRIHYDGDYEFRLEKK